MRRPFLVLASLIPLTALAGCLRVSGDARRGGTVFAQKQAPPPPSSLADRWTTAKIRGKILTDYIVKDSGIRVSTRGGVVTLRGIVYSRRARRRAILLAKETQGVRDVVSYLKLSR